MRADDDDVGLDLRREAEELRHRLATPEVDADSHAREGMVRGDLLVHVEAKVPDEVPRALGGWFRTEHVHEV